MSSAAKDIQPFDLHRMLLGDLPWMFTLEVIVRTVIIFLFTMLMIRLISRRSVGQLSMIELLIVIALGSSVGDPMFYPDVPLLHCMAVIATVVFVTRGVTWSINRNEAIERLVEGEPRRVVMDGCIDLTGRRASQLSNEQLFEMLRSRRVRQLGEVERAYIEQNGTLSIYCFEKSAVRAGMCVAPPWDLEPPPEFPAGESAEDVSQLACRDCGLVMEPQGPLPKCPRCGNAVWVDAVMQPGQANAFHRAEGTA